MTPENLRVAREKLTRVFRYLEALNQHRNPAKRQIREQLWSFWLHDLPDHPSIKRGGTKSGPAKNKPAEFPNGDTGSSGFFLKVQDRKSTRLNSSHSQISYAVFCLKKKKINQPRYARL